MKLLALSTSGLTASAALFVDGAPAGEVYGGNDLTHSETVMTLADELLSSHGLTPADMDGFAADTGPGSFTGVRIGVCAVNAMGFALTKPVYGVCSLRAMAFGLSNSVCSIIDRRNRNIYAALYLDGSELLPPAALSFDEFIKKVPCGTVFTGSFQPFEEDILSAVSGAKFLRENRLTAVNVGAAALLGCRPQSSVMPMYLVPSQAERLHKKA